MSDNNRHMIFDTLWRLDDDGFEDWLQESDYAQELSEYDQHAEYSDYIFRTLDDERANLDIEVDGTILMYGGSGRWDGSTYGASPCGSNVAGIFDMFNYGENEVAFYVEDGDVYARWSSHDNPMGSVMLFRLAPDDYIGFLENGNPIGGHDEFVKRTSSIAPFVNKVYGW